jgi:Ca2+-binding RTX toxin-like protein
MTALVGLLAGVVMAQGLAVTGPATPAATSVQVVTGRLAIVAGPGAVNRIAVRVWGQTYRVTDVVPVAAGTGCQPVAQTEVSCPASSVLSVFFQLGDGDDTADLQVAIPTQGGGDTGNDTVWGSSAEDTVYGGAGTDTIYGNGGADKLYGGVGKDTLYGGSGSDELYGDDVVAEPGCLLAECADWLYGGTGEDYLDGGDGGDKLDGGLDDDTIIGSGDGMRDMVFYDDRTNSVGVNLSGTSYDGELVDLPAESGGELGDDGTLVEHDTVTGVQWVSTGSGDDTLIGPGGDDPIIQNSGTGADQCDPDGNDGVKLADC